MALRIIIDFNSSKKKEDQTYPQGVHNLTLYRSGLGVPDGQLALLGEDVHILLPSARPADSSRPQLSLLLLRRFDRVGCLKIDNT